MPWSPADAERHTKKADDDHLRDVWARVANRALEEGKSDAVAIKIANAAVDHSADRIDRLLKRGRWAK